MKFFQFFFQSFDVSKESIWNRQPYWALWTFQIKLSIYYFLNKPIAYGAEKWIFGIFIHNIK